DPRGTNSKVQRAGGRSLPEARSRGRRAGDVGARRGRPADSAQRPPPELPGGADQRRGRPARSGQQGRREAGRRAGRGAAVARASQDVHGGDVQRVLLSQPELSQRQGRVEGARLRGHGDRRPHDALVRHRALDPAFRPRLLPGRPPGREVHQRPVAERALHHARDHHRPPRRGRPHPRRGHRLLRQRSRNEHLRRHRACARVVYRAHCERRRLEMKRKAFAAAFVVTVSLVVLGVLCGMVVTAQDSGQRKYTVKVPNGLAFSEFKGYEGWQTVSISQNEKHIAVILGNPAMIKAYQSGIPGNGKPFPDGSKMAKVHWNPKKLETFPNTSVPESLHDVDFMVKDSKRFAGSGGWGWAAFNYDAASDTFTHATTADQPPQGNDAKCGLACHTIVKAKDYVFTAYGKR